MTRMGSDILHCLEEILWAYLLFEEHIFQLGSLSMAEIVLRGRIQLLVRRRSHVSAGVALEQRLVRLHESLKVPSVAFSVHFIKNY